MMQIELELQPAARPRRLTQVDKLEAHFRARPGMWLPMPQLAQVITQTGIGAAVHSRVADLRTKRGMNIEHRGGSESVYRYLPAS